MKKIRKFQKSDHKDQRWSDYGYHMRRKKSRTDWAGIKSHNGFQHNIESINRIQGLRLFYRETEKAQAVARRLTQSRRSSGLVEVKPQLAPAYTDYPAMLGTQASIGLTSYLTYRENAKADILSVYLKEYLENPTSHDKVNVDPNQYKSVVQTINKVVEARLILESLYREPSLMSVEYYRLFCASQKSGLDSLTDIIEVVVLYGDVFMLPEEKIHPTTGLILEELLEISQPYLKQLKTASVYKLIEIGTEWVKVLSVAAAKYLPSPDSKGNSQAGLNGNNISKDQISKDQKLDPLDQPRPPMINRPGNIMEQIANAIISQNPLKDIFDISPPLLKNGESASDVKDIVADMVKTLELAVKGNDSRQGHDIRSDLVEVELGLKPFEQSPIQGMPESGYEVSVKFGDNTCTEELFDRPISMPSSFDAVKFRELDNLRTKAQPVTDVLKRNLYINFQNVPVTERYTTSGSLDGNRLSVGDFSDAVFKRYKIKQEVDQRGSPLLLIACDGSASLSRDQMQMLKILTLSWLDATTKTGMKIMAGLYHSGDVHQGRSGPLIQWLYHPVKTPAIGRREAASGLVTLPESGTGAQSDALSLKFIFEEAAKLSRRQMVYMILLTDTAWNKSFKDSKITPEEEVYNVLADAYNNFEDKLNITLVALGVPEERNIGMIESLVDYTVKVPNEQLANYDSVADKISAYVTKCMRERNSLVQKSQTA